MSRINTNVTSMIAQRNLGLNNQSLNTSLERLSTGLRINRGKDDPAGLIASENLRAEKAAIGQAIGNAERADQVVNIAEGGLTEISGMLVQLESLVVQSANDAGLSSDEKEANQLQVDSILETIDRIANSTSFQGSKLLNGNFAYTTSSVTSAELADVEINAARIAEGATLTVDVTVVTSAQTGAVALSTGATVATSAMTVEIAGNKGSQQLTFAVGTTQAQVITAINSFKDVTGLSATASGANTVRIESTEFGSEQFSSVSLISGTTTHSGAVDNGTGGADSATDSGVDIVANINGSTATGKGLEARARGTGFDVKVTVAAALNTDGGNSTFGITGGGAKFQLGPDVELSQQESIGIEAVTTGNLGSAANGLLSSLKTGGANNVEDGNTTTAQAVVQDAIKQVSGLRGRLGSFQSNVVQSTIRALGVALENTAAAESQIRDTDFAEETAALTRNQILVNASTNVLGIANSQPQNVLALLG